MILRNLKKAFPRELIVKELINAKNNVQTAKNLNMPPTMLKELIESYKIEEEEYKLDRYKRKWLLAYDNIVAVLNRHPSTAELQAKNEWKTVHHAICKFWGSFDKFRHEFGIEKIGIGNFADENNKQLWQEGLNKGREIRTQRKEERKQRILKFLKDKKAVSIKQLKQELDITESCLSVYLNELLQANLIQRLRSGRESQYIGVTP